MPPRPRLTPLQTRKQRPGALKAPLSGQQENSELQNALLIKLLLRKINITAAHLLASQPDSLHSASVSFARSSGLISPCAERSIH